MDKLKQLNEWKKYIIKKKFMYYIDECISDYAYKECYKCEIIFYVSEIKVKLL